MTGVEAVSNGVTAFRSRARRRRTLTLTVIIAILIVLLFGIAYLAKMYQRHGDGAGRACTTRAC